MTIFADKLDSEAVLARRSKKSRWNPVKLVRLGLEHPTKGRGKTQILSQSGAKSGARGAQIDPDLATLVDAWANLSEAIRAGIMAIVRATGSATAARC